LQEFVEQRRRDQQNNNATSAETNEDSWEQLDAVLQLRAQLAEQVDCEGMQHLLRAYQNVRHADYGTSQAAKRSLFKFEASQENDFNLFGMDEDDNDNKSGGGLVNNNNKIPTVSAPVASATTIYSNEDDEEYDEYSDEEDVYQDIYGDFDNEDDFYQEDDNSIVEQRSDVAVKTQSRWIRNQFGHGVFVGRIPKTASVMAGEAAICSSRLRSREEPNQGIDLGGPSGFAGFICRVCSDGGTYEAFVRTGAWDEDGIEYVCEFSTSTKQVVESSRQSRNRFTTVRLPFENFKPVQRQSSKSSDSAVLTSVPPFRGRDVRNIGFRYRSASNQGKSKVDKKGAEWNRFYLALSYIKLYRSQPEPEFVYLSDARIPPVVRDGMVRHASRQLVTAAPSKDNDSGEVRLLLDESTMTATANDPMGRSPEETYYKYRGEEILKKSGLSYAIVRIAGFNESPSGEASTIELTSQSPIIDSSTSLTDAAVSRADVAQVCVSALLDPHALNKSFYVTQKKVASSQDEDMSAKFAALPIDEIA